MIRKTFFCFFLLFLTSPLLARSTSESVPYRLYLDQKYELSMLEIRRAFFLRRFDLQADPSLPADLYLLLYWNEYRLNHWENVIQAKEIQTLPTPHLENLYQLKSLASLQAGDSQAATKYLRAISPEKDQEFANRMSKIQSIDPEEAANYSRYFPGSGFLLSENYASFGVSAVLNLSFLYGTLYFFARERYALSFFFLFFEIQWYQGGIRGSREKAEEYNRLQKSKGEKEWIRQSEETLWKFEFGF